MENKKYKIEAEIDLTGKPGKTKIKRIIDPWFDLGLILEVLGAMIDIAAKYTEKTKEEVADYCKDYIDRMKDDYKTKLE
ncbi:MAG: hypothetical protein HY378_00545 [Candidatus Brennerbacteria bacterium]|nr:hypothetical protein [Candidatus Brennerbacteria bacterium]